MSLSSRFECAVLASQNPADFAALLEKPEMDANMVSPITGLPLITQLIIDCSDDQLPPLLAILVQNHVDLQREVKGESIPLGTAAGYAKKHAYDFLLHHTDKALINRPMDLPVLAAAVNTTLNIKNSLLIVKDLLEVQNANVDMCNSSGDTALSIATKHMQPEVINYLLANKANIWLGSELPLVTAFMKLRSYANTLGPNGRSSPENVKIYIPYSICLSLLVTATYNYFYHFAALYDGSLEELRCEFIAWENYLMFNMPRRIIPYDNGQFTTLFRDILLKNIFKPILERTQMEKSQRLPICWALDKLVRNSQVTQSLASNQNALFDTRLIGEIFSYTFVASIHSLSFQEKWQAALQQTLLKINMAQKKFNNGVWYSLDYLKYMNSELRSYDEKYTEGYAPNEYWEMTAPYVFKIKANVLPATALQAFLSGLTIVDCGSVLVACQYAALLKMIGAEKFNIIFAADAAPLTISRFIYDHSNPISYFYKRSGATVTTGDMCYFSGVEFFSKKHPLGHARGWSVVCTGQNAGSENLYYGFGRDTFKVSSMTDYDLAQSMVNMYNLPRDHYKHWLDRQDSPEQSDLAQENIPKELTYTEAMPLLQGYEPDSTVSPDYEKIWKYLQKETLTEDEFITDYDNFLCAGRYPSFFSRPTSITIELPQVLQDEKKESPPSSPRIGIPTLRY